MKRENRNERQVLKKIAQAVKLLQSLENMELSKNDSFEVQLAKGLLMGIIDHSGYRAEYHWLFGILISKVPTTTV